MIETARADLIVGALETGSGFDEAADLAKVPRQALHDVIVRGIREAGSDTAEADFAAECRAAVARHRKLLRQSAMEAAARNHRASADYFRLYADAVERPEPEPENDVRGSLLPMHDHGVREAALTLLDELDRFRRDGSAA